ncbi:trimeric intracellular cation channel family protein [Kribbella shirazensis]|uniref:Putative membrane protein YeiH n=1 Tax=Kribbella shirazensis TaxID=1105143 RepID=A0A7X6A574_9ACTN|nr:trimeric intracellular cation channel family protein [Kribbella shirazensis]NIK61668.1 putative membrane protein YeiH [Kribbella shirazensis]
MASLLLVLDLAGILVFAISGALLAVRRKLDIIGLLALATLTALGGGWIRDILIGAVPPASLADWRYLLVPVIAALTTFWFHPVVTRRERTVDVLDAFGLGLFCVAGALKAVEYGVGPVPAILLGIVTAAGGGVLRDVVALRVPTVFGPGELYAIPAAAGATIAVVGHELEFPVTPVAVVAATVAVTWRLLAITRGWHAPVPRT